MNKLGITLFLSHWSDAETIDWDGEMQKLLTDYGLWDGEIIE